MYEVEVKLRADHETVRERLAGQDAEPIGSVRQVDTYYDAPHRDFATTDEALRIREETPIADGSDARTVLTYKGPKVDDASKSRREVETAVADGEAAGDLLAALGFEPAATVEKRRERFALGEYTVTLDHVTDLGEFVEVETAADDVDSAREGAERHLRDLGLDPADGIRTSYLGLLLGGEDGD